MLRLCHAPSGIFNSQKVRSATEKAMVFRRRKVNVPFSSQILTAGRRRWLAEAWISSLCRRWPMTRHVKNGTGRLFVCLCCLLPLFTTVNPSLQNNGRVGRGKGYYDRYLKRCMARADECECTCILALSPADDPGHDLWNLAFFIPLTPAVHRPAPWMMGVAFPCQILDSVPMEAHDVILHEVVTQTEL